MTRRRRRVSVASFSLLALLLQGYQISGLILYVLCPFRRLPPPPLNSDHFCHFFGQPFDGGLLGCVTFLPSWRHFRQWNGISSDNLQEGRGWESATTMLFVCLPFFLSTGRISQFSCGGGCRILHLLCGGCWQMDTISFYFISFYFSVVPGTLNWANLSFLLLFVGDAAKKANTKQYNTSNSRGWTPNTNLKCKWEIWNVKGWTANELSLLHFTRRVLLNWQMPMKLSVTCMGRSFGCNEIFTTCCFHSSRLDTHWLTLSFMAISDPPFFYFLFYFCYCRCRRHWCCRRRFLNDEAKPLERSTVVTDARQMLWPLKRLSC